jgi:hypothetical protein
MEISSLPFISAGSTVQSLKAKSAVASYKENVENADSAQENNANASDSYQKSDSAVTSETGIYSKESIKKTVDEMEKQRTQALTNMVSEMLGKQSQAKGLSFIKDLNLTPTQTDISEAQDSISDGGFWSVDSVASRIMDMASLLANGDASKLSTLKDAIVSGFGNAASALGRDSLDDMPDITKDTYKEVMKRFDEFSDKLNGNVATENKSES